MRRSGLLLVMSLAATACAGSPTAAYPDIEVDLSAMNILPVLAGSAPAKVSADEAITRLASERGPMQVVRVGRRWASGRTVWVVVSRSSANGACADCWMGWTIDDQNGRLIANFDAASLRAFGIPAPSW